MKIDIRPRLPIYGLRMSDAFDHASSLVPFASQNFNLRGMWSLGTGDLEVYSGSTCSHGSLSTHSVMAGISLVQILTTLLNDTGRYCKSV